MVERPAKILVVHDVPKECEGDTAWLTRAGFDGYVEKPIDVESFPHHVQRFCA